MGRSEDRWLNRSAHFQFVVTHLPSSSSSTLKQLIRRPKCTLAQIDRSGGPPVNGTVSRESRPAKPSLARGRWVECCWSGKSQTTL
jgi:hypothetical protein